MARIPVVTACLLAAVVAGIVPALAQSTDARFASPRKFMASTGDAIYADVCQGCHMPGGVGATGAGTYPALAHDAKLASADYLMALVIGGHNGMPPFGDLLDDAQVAAVANFVRSHFGNSYPANVTAADAKALRH
jgi:mono/diheme cytochrome c family protein